MARGGRSGRLGPCLHPLPPGDRAGPGLRPHRLAQPPLGFTGCCRLPLRFPRASGTCRSSGLGDPCGHGRGQALLLPGESAQGWAGPGHAWKPPRAGHRLLPRGRGTWPGTHPPRGRGWAARHPPSPSPHTGSREGSWLPQPGARAPGWALPAPRGERCAPGTQQHPCAAGLPLCHAQRRCFPPATVAARYEITRLRLEEQGPKAFPFAQPQQGDRAAGRRVERVLLRAP